MELQGQVAIVTGAGRGIGRVTALELGRMGADIVVAELDRANTERTVSEVHGLGRRALAVPTDVTSRKNLGAMVEQTRAEFGRIDILVNNAGIYRAAETLDVTEEYWDAVMNINAKGVFFASQAVLPIMIAQKRGVIVSLASMAGKIGSRANLPYNASKAAVISMTKSLAIARTTDPPGADGAAGRRRQRDRIPRVTSVGLHHRPSAQRRWRAGHARLRTIASVSRRTASAWSDGPR
jgi:NAD(P)-dependent dehydrogenase (short-subunit alcohol dehydrogenase family)